MSDPKPVRRIGSITIGDTAYDLAMNGEAMLAVESPDIYGRPSARKAELVELAVGEGNRDECWGIVCQYLLNQLAYAMIDRDAALARLHKTGEEAK